MFGTNRAFRTEGIAKIGFSRKPFLVNFGMDFYRFWGGLGSRFSDFVSLEKKLENEAIFGVVKNPEPLNCGW